MGTYKPVTHVIFDMDGLLLDSEKLYLQARKEVCAMFDKVYTWELNVHTLGWPGRDSARYMVERMALPISPEECYSRQMERYRVLFPSTTVMPDSEVAYDKVFSAIIRQYGKEYTWDVRAKVMGTPEDVSAQIVVRELQLPISAEEFLNQQKEKQKNVLPTVTLMPGAERLVRHLYQHKVPIAVATSSGTESVGLKLTNHKELFSLFDHIIMGSSDPDVKNGKPAPDIFQICAARFPDKPDPEKVLVFEDAPNGVLAGRAASMQVVMVPDPHVVEEKRKEATLVLSSLLDFQPELFGLPPF